MVVPRFLRFYWWRFNGGGFACGTAFGLSAAVIQRIIAPALDPRLTFLLTVSFGFAGSIIGTFLSPETPKTVLENFYKTTRPFGFWKPMKKLLTEQEREKMKKEYRNDLLALPFTVCWHISWLIWPMLLLIHNFKGFAGVAAICLVGLAGMYFFWYRNLPKDNFYEKINTE
jgi:drug/metabolite transporter (DMT)-like permease